LSRTGRWLYAGHVGTGFDRAALKSLYGMMQPLRTDKKHLDQKGGALFRSTAHIDSARDIATHAQWKALNLSAAVSALLNVTLRQPQRVGFSVAPTLE